MFLILLVCAQQDAELEAPVTAAVVVAATEKEAEKVVAVAAAAAVLADNVALLVRLGQQMQERAKQEVQVMKHCGLQQRVSNF